MQDAVDTSLASGLPVAHRPGRAAAAHAAGPRLAGVVALACLAGWWVFPAERVLRWTQEGGPIERLTVLFYLAAAAALLAAWRSLPRGVAAASALTMVAFAAREADWHLAFTGTSMLRVSYYLGPSPTAHKLASLAVLGVLAIAWTHLGLACRRAWRANRLRAGALGANLGTFLGVLVLTKSLDRSVSILAEDFGVEPGLAMRALQVALEEPLEMALPLLAMVAMRQYVARRGGR